MIRLATAPDSTPIALFNPCLDNFIFTYDKKEYMIDAYTIATFPKYIADRLARKLAEYIIGTRGVIKNQELDTQELLDKIYVNEYKNHS